MQSHTCTASGSLSFRRGLVRLEAVVTRSLSCLVHWRPLPALISFGCYMPTSFCMVRPRTTPYWEMSAQIPFQYDAKIQDNNGMHKNIPCNVDISKVEIISTKSQLNNLIDILKKRRIFGLDLEHSKHISFLGITSLMQISFLNRNFIVDTLEHMIRFIIEIHF